MTMTRREMLGVATAAAVVTAAARVSAAPAMDHSQHNVGASTLADAAANSVKSGEACLQHCLDTLTTGDTSMADCAKSVRDMIALAQATYLLSLANSKHYKATAKLAGDAAKDCEIQCKKHADKHAVCKTCMECCQKLIAEAAKA